MCIVPKSETAAERSQQNNPNTTAQKLTVNITDFLKIIFNIKVAIGSEITNPINV
jgi:hypothetical protein